ncbi:MAG: BamA/TamA family outer membrane protein [Thermoanaerobaculia bacterium]|nr:BamA/TamA family outer membrane protein [Thermoanaerobaculia bacterium]
MTERSSQLTAPQAVRKITGVLVGVAVLFGAVTVAQAQGFGKNKIAYREFDWRIYHSPHFDVYYYTENEDLLQKMVSFAESAYDDLSRTFDYQIQDPVPLIAYESHSAFLQTNVLLGAVPEGAQAFATSRKFRIVMPMDPPDPELQALLKHELTHIFQYYVVLRSRIGGLRGQPPLWFIEGMASYFGEDEAPGDKKYMIDAVVNDNIPSVTTRGGGFFAYRFGNAVFSYIEERWGREAILDFIYEMRNTFGSRPEKAVERTFRMDVEDFDDEFRRWARRKYLPELLATGEPGDFGRPFRLGDNKQGHEMSPAASPSGDLVAAFTTDRGEIDISLFDAKTRKRIKNLTRGLNTQIRGLQVRTNRQIGTDLAFSPDGNTIAVFARRERGYSLLLYDAISGNLRRIVDMDVEQQRSPAFSPDNRYLAFSGNVGGTTDIFFLDLDTLEVTNITRDPMFDATPTFSPDGRWLTYTGAVGAHEQIFRLDLQNPERRFQITTGDYNNKEPAYSLDGGRIYFSSDRTGADNVFSIDLDSGRVLQYTNAITGCDRPTVLPLPDGGERLVYNAYWKGRFSLYTTDVEEPVAEPESVQIADQPATLGALPTFEPSIEVVLDDANDEEFNNRKFFLENAQSFVGVDTNQIFVGRVFVSFADYLGDRRIFLTLGAVDTFSDFDALYLNQTKRRQWGARVFDTRVYGVTQVSRQGDFFASTDREQVYGITGAEFLNIYPFDFNNRVELRLGYYVREYDFGLQVRDRQDQVIPIIDPRKDDYPQFSAAFVSDNTVYDQWGPAKGHRVRFDYSYAADIEESGKLTDVFRLDARQYIPTTRRSGFALRLWGYESTGTVPQPVWIGGFDTVRGVDLYALPGNRAFHANVEWRFPLIDALAFPGFAIGGIRGRVFFDIGGAYFPDFEPDYDFEEDDRLVDGIASYGFGLSVNLFGLPLHWDFAKLTDLEEDVTDSFETQFWIGFRF